MLNEYTWDTAEGMPLLIGDGSTSYVTGPGGLPLEQISGTTVYYYHQDQLGSTRAMTDSSGVVQSSYSYDPYGNLTASTGTLANPIQYAGQYVDSESGLYYLRARYYEPVTGQFLTIDPVVARTRAPYAYTADSPLNGRDPSGLCWPAWACGVENAVGGAVQTGVRTAANWVSDNSDTLTHVASVLAIVGVACGLGIVTAEATCFVFGVAALGLGAALLGADTARAQRTGDWGPVINDALGEAAGVIGLRAAAGSFRAVFWALASLIFARASEQGMLPYLLRAVVLCS
jgi:RHS repeat-associated protein